MTKSSSSSSSSKSSSSNSSSSTSSTSSTSSSSSSSSYTSLASRCIPFLVVFWGVVAVEGLEVGCSGTWGWRWRGYGGTGCSGLDVGGVAVQTFRGGG